MRASHVSIPLEKIGLHSIHDRDEDSLEATAANLDEGLS